MAVRTRPKGRTGSLVMGRIYPAVPTVPRPYSVTAYRRPDEDVWVIGGGTVYAAFLPHADRLVVTEVDLRVDGDTWAPPIGDEWRRISRTPEQGWSVSSSGLRYAVTEYARGSAAPAG